MAQELPSVRTHTVYAWPNALVMDFILSSAVQANHSALIRFTMVSHFTSMAYKSCLNVQKHIGHGDLWKSAPWRRSITSHAD